MLFDDIEVLLVLSKAKSLSQAANQLYMSRPGLSQKITNIEKRFGASLINRTSTGISLTQAGKVAVKLAQNMADMERVMASQIAAIDEHFPANVTVGHEPRRRGNAAAAAGGPVRERAARCPRAPGCGL